MRKTKMGDFDYDYFDEEPEWREKSGYPYIMNKRQKKSLGKATNRFLLSLLRDAPDQLVDIQKASFLAFLPLEDFMTGTLKNPPFWLDLNYAGDEVTE